MKLNRRNALTACGITLVSFAAGSLITAHLVRADGVSAAGNRAFELRIYHAVPGKVPALESRFRDTASKLLAKHDLDAVGYWVPDDESNTFVYILAHPQPRGGKKELGCHVRRPGFSDHDESRAGGQAGRKGRLHLHASVGLFAVELARQAVPQPVLPAPIRNV